MIAQSKQVRMIAVGVGSSIDDDELEEIADGKRENVVHVDDFDKLIENENNVLFASCHPGKIETQVKQPRAGFSASLLVNCYGCSVE